MLFKQRKPRKFSYKSRKLNRADGDDSEDLKSQWQALREEKSGSSSKNRSLIVLLVALGMIIVLWYILENYQN